ncbi:hypothetical protein ACVINY_002013 [Sinorhizobium meliloti]
MRKKARGDRKAISQRTQPIAPWPPPGHQAHRSDGEQGVQIQKSHDEERRGATHQRHAEFAAHEQGKARFAGSERQHDVEQIVNLGHPEERQKTAPGFTREVVVDPIAADEIGGDEKR